MNESKNNTIAVSAPGRICLFGEHQDYLGLPVIAAAVNLRAALRARPGGGRAFVIRKPDIRETEMINLNGDVTYEKPRDYFKSGWNVMRRAGADIAGGLEVEVTSEIPIGKGCSGSSALLVAWCGLLARAGGLRIAPEQLAYHAYEAEVLEFKEPGGMMDHYASALGGVLYIETAGEIRTHSLPAPPAHFVLGDSLAAKDTTGVLGRVRANAAAGIEYLRMKDKDLDLAEIDADKLNEMLGADVAEPVHKAAVGAARNRDITRAALAELQTNNPDIERIGALLTKQHAILRDNLGISTPRIEALLDAALAAGAQGGKINGSGGGGCMFACCRGAETAANAARAIDAAGGRAHIINIDTGFREESE